MSWLLRSSDVGSANRARLLRLLHISGPLTRADLAVTLGVSRATIGPIVQPLIDEGVLVEQAARSAGESGGKPAKPLWFGDRLHLGAGFLSPDECTFAAVRMDGRIDARESRPVDASDPEEVLDLVRATAASVLTGRSVLGIGVAFAGTVDSVTGTLLANYRRPWLQGLQVGEALRRAQGVPVFADHHPRVQAYGDAWFGPGKEVSPFASVVTGEVLGVGIVEDGEVLKGPRGAGGEIGHMVVDLRGEVCACGRRGCWETVATLPWLRSRAAELGLADPRRVTAARLVAAIGRSATAERLAKEYAGQIALGLANLEQILGLGTYFVHGDAAGGGEPMRRWIEDALVANSPDREPHPRIQLVTQPDEATLLGGTALALSHLFPRTPSRAGSGCAPPRAATGSGEPVGTYPDSHEGRFRTGGVRTHAPDGA
ncbi:hypothetical protein CGZ94_00040 [Enemella evansiae]|uniref:ROK family transcriptional regulator n=2 Tax=Enemella evansiae TaxID=2016499 RepID=A0A255GPL3_9ACTN|nr:hypothetical protein CGZ94_00040 [Enemella evansiae]